MPSCRFCPLILTIYFIAIYSKLLTEAGSVEDYLKSLESAGYDRNQPPEAFQLKKGYITVFFRFNRLVDMDDFSGQISFAAWFGQMYEDERVRFNLTNRQDRYCKTIPRKRVWLPGANILNVVRKPNANFIAKNSVRICGWGVVFHSLHQVYHISCIPNLRNFPFDTQECSIKIGLWTYFNEDINIEGDLINRLETPQIIKDNPRWNLHSFHQQQSVEMVQDVKGNHLRKAMVLRFKIDRKASLVALGLLTTLTTGVIAALTSFCIGDSLRHRLLLSISSVIVMFMLITAISRIIPVNRYGVPIIVTYASIFLGFAILIVFSAILHSIIRSLAVPVPSSLAGFFERLPQAVIYIIVLPVSASKFFPLTSDGKESLNTGSGEASNDSERTSITTEMTMLHQEQCAPGSPRCSPNLRQWAIMVKVFDGLHFWIYLIAAIGLFISMATSYYKETEG